MMLTVKKRRKLSLTNYNKRVALLKGNTMRVIVRRTNKSVLMQVAEYAPAGDRIVASVNSKELAPIGWNPKCNIPTAYLTGLMLARKAKSLGAKQFVLDIGIYKPVKSSVIFAAAKGAADGGMKLTNSIEFDQKRLSGQHIANYADKLKGDEQTYKRQFADYIEKKVDVSRLNETFENAKKKIMSE